MVEWCNRCNKYHDSLPLDEKKLIEKHSSDIAREIDQEILSKITKGVVASATLWVASEFQKSPQNIVEIR